MEFLPILQDFVPSRGRCPATLCDFQTAKKQGKGTADHMMPFGDWFSLSVYISGFKSDSICFCSLLRLADMGRMTAKLHCEQGRRHSLPVDAVCGLWRRLIAYGYRLTPLTPSSHMRHKKMLYHESLLGNEKKTDNNLWISWKKNFTSEAHASLYIIIRLEKLATEQPPVQPNWNPVTHLRATGSVEAPK